MKVLETFIADKASAAVLSDEFLDVRRPLKKRDAPLLLVFLAHPLPLVLLAHPMHHLLGLGRGHDRPPLLDEPSDDPQDRESRPEGPVH